MLYSLYQPKPEGRMTEMKFLFTTLSLLTISSPIFAGDETMLQAQSRSSVLQQTICLALPDQETSKPFIIEGNQLIITTFDTITGSKINSVKTTVSKTEELPYGVLVKSYSAVDGALFGKIQYVDGRPYIFTPKDLTDGSGLPMLFNSEAARVTRAGECYDIPRLLTR